MTVQQRRRAISLSVGLLGLILASPAPAQPAAPGAGPAPSIGEPWPGSDAPQPWTGSLQGGGQVRVDPRTNRAVVEGPGGYETQLWDGVHRLSDGTELIVRDGRVVPNRQILDQGGAAPEPPLPQETPQAVPPRSPAAAGRDFCSDLVRQSCGSDNACSDATKCSAAHQLQRMAAEERARGADPAAPVEADLKCREALRNDFFAPCEAGAKP